MHEEVGAILLLLAGLAGLALVACVAVSAIAPGLRLWPPIAGTRDWRFWCVWGLIVLYVLSALGLGATTFGSLGLSPAAAFLTGGVSFAAGHVLAFWGAGRIGTVATLGIRDRLITDGPYRWSRNPQYLGDVLVLGGATLLFNSAPMIIPALLGCAAVVLAPFAEEPWLKERYGKSYNDYLKRVPRYF